MKVTPAEYAELAEWSDRMTAATSLLLNRGRENDKAQVRMLLDEWLEKFEAKGYEAQKNLADVDRLARHYSRRNPIPPGGCTPGQPPRPPD